MIDMKKPNPLDQQMNNECGQLQSMCAPHTTHIYTKYTEWLSECAEYVV